MTADDGTEWMWVEVLRWNGDTIEGVLSNEPFNVPDLHAGQRVTGSMDDVFDYIYRRGDASDLVSGSSYSSANCDATGARRCRLRAFGNRLG